MQVLTQINGKPIVLLKTFVEQHSDPGIYMDSKLKGFGLKITEAGRKIFIIRKKPRGAKHKVTVTLGEFNQNITIERARKWAQDQIALILTGVNPNDLRRTEQENKVKEKQQRKIEQEKASITLRTVFDDYIESHELKDSTKKSYKYDLFKCMKDWLDKPLVEITPEMVERRHKKIAEAHPGQANHVARILRALFNHTNIRHELDLKNPVKRLSQLKKWKKLKPRQRIIQDHQLKDWFAAVLDVELEMVRDYILLMLFTGLRKAEAGSLKWDNVDLKGKTLTVLDTKNGRDHTLPLPIYLVKILEQRWHERDSEFVFPDVGKKGYVTDPRKYLYNVVEKSKVQFTPHDLRRTFTTIAAGLLPEYIVKRLTNHVDGTDTTQNHYVWVELEKLREPMEDIAQHILLNAGVNEGVNN